MHANRFHVPMCLNVSIFFALATMVWVMPSFSQLAVDWSNIVQRVDGQPGTEYPEIRDTELSIGNKLKVENESATVDYVWVYESWDSHAHNGVVYEWHNVAVPAGGERFEEYPSALKIAVPDPGSHYLESILSDTGDPGDIFSEESWSWTESGS